MPPSIPKSGHASPPLPSFYRLAPLLVFAGATIINFLPLGERRFEDNADTLVTAAGYAFSIWGVIFLGLIGFSIVLARGLEPDSAGLRRGIHGLILAGLASIAFVPISIRGNELLGFLDVVLHLIALIYAYGGLRDHIRSTPPRSRAQRFWFFGPSMYLAWIAAATVIAASLALDELGFSPDYQVALILAVVLITVLFNVGSRFLAQADAVCGLTVAWALTGIGVEQRDQLLIPWAAWVGAALLVLSWLYRVIKLEYNFYATPGYYAAPDPILDVLTSSTSSSPS